MGNRIILSGILISFFFLLIRTSSSIGKETALTLIYTSNNLGEVELCGCPESGDNGGLARRSHYLKTVREEAKNLLILDAGDALVISFFSQGSEREKARKRAEVVLRIYEKIGYDALNIGDTDLGLGVEYLKALQEKSKIPFLSANLKEKETGMPIFKSHLVRQVDGTRIGIIGLLTLDIHPSIQKGLTSYLVEDPIKAALETINHDLADCDHIIALAHLTPIEIQTLTQKVSKISVIIGGNDRSFIFPKQFSRSIYVQTDAFGAHVGKMNLKLVKGSGEFIDVSPRTVTQDNIGEVQNTKGKNIFENYLSPMHPGIESDPEIEQLITVSRDRLKRPFP